MFAGGEINVTQGDGSGMVDIFCSSDGGSSRTGSSDGWEGVGGNGGGGGGFKHAVSELSVRRYELAAAVVDHSVCFGGGNIGVGGSDVAGAKRIDCIDTATFAWKKASMMLPRTRLAAGVSRTVNSTGSIRTEVCWGGGRNATVECFEAPV